MANTIKVKRSSVAGKVPTTGDLELGEIAVNTYDGKMYIEKNNGTASVVQIGDVVGAASSTDNALVRFDGTTGKLIQNGNITQDDNGNLANVNSIGFDTTPGGTLPTTEGSLYWDSADGIQTLNLVMAGGNATQQIGQEQYYRVKASSAITNGQVVMFTGTIGASGGLTAAPATGLTASTASYVMGVATQDIALNDWGYVTSFGLVRQIDTSAFTDGAILYLNPSVAGGLTTTIPSAPNPKVQVCAVVYAAANGSLFIRPSFGGILGQYEGDVEVSTPANGNLLIRNQTSGKWVNANLTAGSGVSVTNGAGSVTIANTGVTSITGTASQITASASTGGVTLSLPSTINVDTSGNAGSATNLAGGAANKVPYQTGSGATSFVDAPTASNQVLTYNGTGLVWQVGAGSGTVTSVAMTVPTGLSISGSPITTSGTLALTFTSGYSIPTTASQANWDTAYTDRLKWDGGSTGLVAATGRTSLGGTTVGQNFFTLTDPGAITFPRINADNTVSALDAATFRTAIGAGTSSTTGTVTSVGMTVPTGLTISGSPITTSGTLALTFTAGYSIPTTTSQTNWDTAYSDRLKWDGGSSGLTASTGRTSLGATTLGSNLFTITNPSAVTFPRFNADNTVSSLSAADFRTAIGAGTGSGTVTSVGGTSPISSTGGTAPTISIAQATSSTSGYLSSTDWNTFNNKGSGTVTSVSLSAGTGISISGSPITTSGTITVTNTAPNQLTTTTGSPAYYGARAWVNFNGTGTVAIRQQVNVSSITDAGTGKYIVNFSTAMPDADYAGGAIAGNSNNFVGIDSDVTVPNASAFRIACYDAGNTPQDGAYVMVVIFR